MLGGCEESSNTERDCSTHSGRLVMMIHDVSVLSRIFTCSSMLATGLQGKKILSRAICRFTTRHLLAANGLELAQTYSRSNTCRWQK